MRRRIPRVLCAAVASVVLTLAGSASAASGDADGTYTVTVTKVEVSKDGSTFTTVFEGSQAINIAAADAGAVAASLVSGASVDAGAYTAVRVTIGAALQVKGFVNNGATTIYTDGGTDAGAFSTNGGAADTPGADYAISTFTVPVANRVSTTTGLSITVQAAQAKTVSVSFDASGVLTQFGGVAQLGPPTVTVS